MNCQAARPRLSAYLDNELDGASVQELREHLKSCADCTARLAAYNRLRAGIRALPRHAPPTKLREVVFSRATPAYRRRARYMGFARHLLAASAFAVTVAAAVFVASVAVAHSRASSLGNLSLAPRVVSVQPRSGTVDWAPSRAIRITFNKPMDQASVAAALRVYVPTAGGEVDATYLRQTLSWDGNTLLLGALGGLRPDTDYFIELAPGVARDQFGNALLAGDTRLAFRTALVLTAREQPLPTATLDAVAPAVPTPRVAIVPLTPTPGQVSTPTAPVVNPVLRSQPTQRPAVTPVPTAAPSPTPPPDAVPAAAPEPTQAPAPPTAIPTATPTSPPPTAPMPKVATPATKPASTPTPPATPDTPYPLPTGFQALYSGSAPVRSSLGVPTGPAVSFAATTLPFERGLMYRRADTATIYVLFFEDPGVWFSFADAWAPGGADSGGTGPVAGQYVPRAGFGAIWNANADFRQRLGYALTPDSARSDALAQQFDGGIMLSSGDGWIYVLYAKGTYERYADTSK